MCLTKLRQYCASSHPDRSIEHFFFSECITMLFSLELPMWLCPWQTIYNGWMDEEEDRRDGRWKRRMLGGLAKWVESKWCRSTLADSMAPLITFNQSWEEGPSQPPCWTPTVSHLISSIPPVHSIFLPHSTWPQNPPFQQFPIIVY